MFLKDASDSLKKVLLADAKAERQQTYPRFWPHGHSKTTAAQLSAFLMLKSGLAHTIHTLHVHSYPCFIHVWLVKWCEKTACVGWNMTRQAFGGGEEDQIHPTYSSSSEKQKKRMYGICTSYK